MIEQLDHWIEFLLWLLLFQHSMGVLYLILLTIDKYSEITINEIEINVSY